MKILFVYPEYPITFWGFQHALMFVGKKAAFPPLGLLTVAAMLPKEWEKRLIDMNVSKLRDKDIKWADYVFVSAMRIQTESVKEVIRRCNKIGIKIVAGGPVFTTGYDEFDGVNHFVLGEAESTLPSFLRDLQKGCAKSIYTPGEFLPITNTPVPLWELIRVKDYVCVSLQCSRGCPWDCEFCDIGELNGHKPRLKTKNQILQELEAIYKTGFRGSIFFADDNLIGNKLKEIEDIVLGIIGWQKERKYPFSIFFQAGLDLSKKEKLMPLLVEAGFNKVFIGIESISEASLVECNKRKNINTDILASVKKIQNYGIQVQGGFIVGFDSDPLTIFKELIDFMQKSGIVVAMVGLLQALRKTALWKRLEAEGRLLGTSSGNNTDGTTNFKPKMDIDVLAKGYQEIIKTIYSPKKYYERILMFLSEYHPPKKKYGRISLSKTRAFLGVICWLGIFGNNWKAKWYFWKTTAEVIRKYPRFFPEFVTLAILGIHFRKVAEEIVKSNPIGNS